VALSRPTGRDRGEFIAAMLASRKLNGRWAYPPSTIAEYDAVLRRARDDDAFEPMLIRTREDGVLVGWFNISNIVRGSFQSAFLGYGGTRAHAGKGYMREGLELVLERAFTELGLHRLEANIQPENAASIALARGAGFVNEGFSERYLKVGGRWRDHGRWAIRAEQWRALRRG
jgi:ribosomal-protein-alanine N-acetyltransferase